ncbi:MAG TPA: hypothetical protein VG826_05390 [Pirellulales bacterium]|nr:hypothetical protein [Pirellulales bacterium]
MNRLHQFIEARCHRVPGCRVRFATLVDAFLRWLPAAERPNWPRHVIAGAIDEMFPRGRTGGQIYVGNLAMQTHKHVLGGGKLRREPI